MSNKNSDTQKTITKGMATVLSATMLATSVVSVLPTQVAHADEAFAIEALNAAIEAVNAASTISEMQAALSGPDLALNLTGYNLLSADGKDTVANQLLNRKPEGGYSTSLEIQTYLNEEVNALQNDETLKAAISAVNAATDVLTMRTALENVALGLILTTYNNLSTPAGKLAAAQLMLDYRNKDEENVIEFGSRDEIQNQLNIAVQEVLDGEALATAVNNVNAATDAAAMKVALNQPYLGLVLNAFNNLSADSQDVVAQQMFDYKGATPFLNKAAVQNQLNLFVTQRVKYEAYAAAVKVVNDATTPTDMQSALESGDLGLDRALYYKLTGAHQLAAAEAVLDARPQNGYYDQPSVQAALDIAVAVERVAQAVDGVNNAASLNSMKSALTSTVLGLDLTVYSDLLPADQNAVVALVLANRSSNFADKAAVQLALDTAIATNAPMAAVNKADVNTMQAALEAQELTALGFDLGTVYTSWSPADKTNVAASVFTARPGTGFVDLAAVQAKFDAAVTARTLVANVNIAPDVAAMQAALENVALGLNLGAYTTWTSVDKAVVATVVLDNVGDGYAGKTEVQAAFDAAVTARTLVANVNIAVDAAAMKAALEALGLNLGAYATWTSVDKTAVATAVLNNVGSGYADQAEVQAAFDDAVTERTLVANVNIAGTTAEMQTALEAAGLGLDLGATYPTWSVADKAAVSAAVLQARPDGDGYADIDAIQVAFDNAVGTVAPMANINGATNATAMEAALKNATLALDLAEYNSLTSTQQTDVANWVLKNRPNGGYADKIVVQEALDIAVAIEYVNIAATPVDMQDALENPVLGLDRGQLYPTWTAADNLDVANTVLTGPSAGSYADQAAIQAAFDAAVTVRIPVANVNIAKNADEMQVALEASALSLTLGALYPTWTAADKADVASMILGNIGIGYTDKTTVQTAFNAAVTVRTPVANVNIAATPAAMQAALEVVALGLNLGAYATWTAADKLDVATAVKTAIPTGGYTDQAAIQAEFDAAVLARTLIANVNNAADEAEMQAALAALLTPAELGVYTSWTAADKTDVATAMLANVGTGYADQAAVQTAFDAAVTARTPVADVNIATTPAAMQAALEANSLSLALGALYPNWTVADKTAVATTVLGAIPAGGYSNQLAVQLAFSAGVTMRTSVANVNIATDATTMQAALEAGALGLDLTEYNKLGPADKLIVSFYVFQDRPVNGFVGQPAVQAALNYAINEDASLAAVNDALDESAMQTALENVGLELSLGVYEGWTTADKLAVATAVIAARPGTGYAGQVAVQAAFDAAVLARTPVANVNIAENAVEMQAALENVALGINLGAYASWTDADKLAVVTAVLGNVGNGYADKATVQAEFDAAVTTRVPVANVNIAVDAAATQTALENVTLGLDLGAYANWTAADKLAVATTVLGNVGNGYADQAAVQAAFDAAVLVRTLVANVNNAVDAETMQTALENVGLALNLGAYASWTAADKLDVATAVLGNIGNGYADQAAVQAAFDVAVTARTPVANVNIAENAVEMQAALENVGLALNLGAYANWTAADKLAVATAVLGNIGDGYADQAAVQAEFDAAVLAHMLVANVNNAADAEAMQAALENAALGLNLGAYANWTDVDKLDVATAVLGNVGDGYADKAAVQTAFDAAVLARTLVANVNNAADAEAMQTALTDLLTPLELGVYSIWTAADKADVAAAVLGNVGDGYADKAAVIVAFNTAVTARTPVANVNIAGDAAEMQLALEDGTLSLTLGTLYPSWTASDKKDVATAVLAIPQGGYTDKAAVQAAFNTAVLARTAVANVNIATTDTALKTALEALAAIVGSGLDLSVYNTLGNTDKLNTSSKVLAARNLLGAGIGFADVTAIQTALDNSLEAGALNRDAAALEIQFSEGDAASHVTDKLTLPSTGVEGSAITWSIDETEVVAQDGKVTRPAFLTGDVTVTLTATLSLNGVEKTKEFVIKVKKLDITDSEAIVVDKAALGIIYSGSDKAVSVTNDLELPTTGVNGTEISWSSSNPAVVAEDGTVNRPAKTASDVTVTLTATITKGNGVVQTKEFDVTVLKLTAFNAAESVAADKAALDIIYSGSDKAVSVTQNLTLPAAGTNGTTITWSSSNAAVVAEDGTVNRPAKTASDVIVTLTATITKNGVVETKEFDVTVLKLTTFNAAESVAADKAALDIIYSGSDKAVSVTNDLTLPAAGVNGTEISWSSSDPTVIAENGTVNRPAKTASDVTVTLTATITKNGVVETKEFDVTVLKLTTFNAAESVAADKAALGIIYSGSDKAVSVTQNLSLPLTGANGTTITWTSSNAAVIAANGTVNRPAKTASDVTVTLTATITKNGVVETKEFDVTVLKLTAFNDAESVTADKAALGIIYSGSDKAVSVTQNLSLPLTGANGTTITWTSSNAAVIAANGTVNRPAKTASDVIVTLTATITKNGVVETKEFDVTVLKLTTFNAAESVAADKAALDIIYSGSDKAVSVTNDLTLPAAGVNGTEISWSSSDPTVIAENGTVNRPAKTASDVTVTLTATITKNGVVETKEFDVTVLKLTTFNAAESVAADKAALDIIYSGSDKAVSVTNDLTLPAAGVNGTEISWSSSDPTVIAENGTVNRPAKTASDVTVTLTATITKNGVVETKEFDVTVLKLTTFNAAESVAADKAALGIIYSGSDKAVSVTQNLSLPLTGANGTTITWTSSNAAVIAANGTVNRPAKTASDVTVTLTATITKNGVVETKEFDVTVLKLTAFNDAESVTADKAALGIIYSGSDKAVSVTQNLSLPLTGANGTTITWTSSNAAVIAANGTVNRPAKTASDVIVTLTATITKNGVVETKEFDVTVLKLTTFNAAESVAADKAALDIIYSGSDKAVSVTNDLTLPAAGVNGTEISWSSSDPTVIAENGTVNRPAKTASDVTVTLTATITKNGVVETKEFDVTVLKLTTFNAAESVAADKAALGIIYSGSDKAVSVTQNLSLPLTGANGTTITWTSSNAAVIAANGTVNRPAKTASDVTVTLTATITKNGVVETKEFDVTVLKLTAFNDAESVTADKAALGIIYSGSDKAVSVTQNLSLPLTGANGTTITWTSSNVAVIAANGTVNRPAKTASDVIVTLTATITKNGVVETKEFDVTVLKLTTFNDAESVAADKAALDITYGSGDKAVSVTQNLTLPATGANSTTITWTSSNATVIAANGTVNRPANTASDVVVTLTATITKNGVVQTKEFDVMVLKQTTSNDAESVAADKAALGIIYGGSDKAVSVTQNLTLPAIGANATTITWTTSNDAVIAADGTVTRPANTASDVIVTLTATITKNDVVETKEFDVTVLKLTAFNDAESVTADKAALDITYGSGDKAVSVTQNLTLPATGANGTTITWTTSNDAIIAADGTVTRPANTASDVVVTLTATITKNGVVQTKEFDVMVLKQTTSNDAESVAADKAALGIIYGGSDKAVSVTQNLTLPATGANGTTITWTSSNAAVIAANGTVTRPANTASDVIVTLTATITKNGVSETKEFDVVVLKQTTFNDAESVAADKTALSIIYGGTDKAVRVTQNLTLPTTGTNGTTITWTSSDQTVVTTDGTVTRPVNAAGDAGVILTATITKNGATEQKTFNLTVLKNDQTPAPLRSGIIVTNNVAGTNDSIRVNSLQAGDVVKVYNSTTGELLGTVTVAAGDTSAIVDVAQLGVAAGTVDVTVTRGSMEESTKTSAVYAAENAKPYVISDTELVTTSGIEAKVKVTPTEGLAYAGTKYVIFVLMDGDSAVSIVALEYDGKSAANLTAKFNTVYNKNHTVKVMILDQYNLDTNNVGTPLADQVILKK